MNMNLELKEWHDRLKSLQGDRDHLKRQLGAALLKADAAVDELRPHLQAINAQITDAECVLIALQAQVIDTVSRASYRDPIATAQRLADREAARRELDTAVEQFRADVRRMKPQERKEAVIRISDIARRAARMTKMREVLNDLAIQHGFDDLARD